MTALRNDRPRAASKGEAKLGLFTRFIRSMTSRKDDQAQATRTKEAEVSSSTRVTRSMSPPKSDPFLLLKLPLELFENVLEFCDADSMSSLRLTSHLLERQTYHEWTRRRQTVEFNSHHDEPEVYAQILEACPQLGAKVTRLILASPDGHVPNSPWRRIPLLAILPQLTKHLPNLQHLEIRYWALQYNLPSLAELAPIFERTKINNLTLHRCVLYGSDLRALLGTPLVAPDHTLLKECSMMGTLVTTLSIQGTSIPTVRTEHSFSVGVQGVNFPNVIRAVFPFREFEGLKYEILAPTGRRVFEVGGYAPINEKREQVVEEVRIVKVV
ncbi:hypothetical protein CKM354_000772000 [Cercospora kikuchii]|uniref:F-box domain-containing protein n=1 Tax=Cercospora kikuchii TaxID=84275 RepID=A0A9P3CKJ2_9PEZI|nr:uncharacterized protein CKM354_000772000 [Cercospora kikuchii]GIZ44524.1 hypothetical protein CKM354_000772000 [Cercospora kikuchii]